MQLFVNDLTVMDFSYLCPQRGMVGESWIVDVILNGDLNEESMVLDFSKVKKQLKYLIDLHIDHKLLVPVEHSYSQVERDNKTDYVKVDFMRPQGRSIHLNCPAEAYAFVYADQVTMPTVSDYLKDVIATHLPDNVEGIELMLRAEVIHTPYYHYTHGLKKHDGNCQRIAHGHRSKVLVYQDQQDSLELQTYWAQRWADIYIGSTEDVVTTADVCFKLDTGDFNAHWLFAYESSQGRFELAIPKAESELIDTDTTVECLAQFMANEHKRLDLSHSYKVLAFEGVGKGAIAYA
ncbi:6-carboxytetrahydropterin synthase [Paraglaciecola hydrolytica]|uniref:6-carboxy-5,6,7,8-tetrahydropterin synthase n=1 Tax=Paraglaciecola hydrolytica TaxID=1799789 RepID=A0A148KMF2_9ALTE|nr:6-carboxytetrahydropterin synthase [Paraglaciecola hydrolytica]KXI27486.1 6-pyruvoyl tetrahydropterin synthase [Paraglaciecola hydrolytica]